MYTKGEWRAVDHQWASPSSPDLPVIFIETAEDAIAEVWGEANAHLIASAPDLYEACKIAIEDLSEVSSVKSRITARKVIRQAIAKVG